METSVEVRLKTVQFDAKIPDEAKPFPFAMSCRLRAASKSEFLVVIKLRRTKSEDFLRYTSHAFCSDFRYESSGIFVLGVGFFTQTVFDFLTSHF